MAKTNHVDTTGWTHERLGCAYLDAINALAVAQGRLDRMTTTDGISPEGRLSRHAKEISSLGKTIEQLVKDLANFEKRAVKEFGWMTTHMKWREDETNQNIEEGSQGGYSEELTAAIAFLEELKGETDGTVQEISS